jgi:hypothetical protein
LRNPKKRLAKSILIGLGFNTATKPFLEREKVTEIFKAGEHVKIVRSDSFYAEELGDQTGLVGTLARVNSNGGMYVTFPHSGDGEFYYLPSEVVRAPGTKPLPEPLKIGDWVKVEGYSATWDGTEGQIETFSPSGLSANIKKSQTDLYPLTFPVNKLTHTEKPKPVFAVGDRVEFTENYSRFYKGDAGTISKVEDGNTGEGELLTITTDKGIRAAAFSKRVKLSTKTKPVPASKYTVGDWVKVEGYSASNWDGNKGKVTLVGSYDSRDGYTYVISMHEGKPFVSGGFEEKYLKATTQPFIPAHKVGDWVEVSGCCADESCNGTVWQVVEVPTGGTTGNYYHLKNDDRLNANYAERFLKATTKPEPKPRFKVGDWVEVTGWNSGMNGTKLQIKLVPDTKSGYYNFENKDTFFGFSERHLTATEAPHWTEAKPVGATAQALYSGGGTNRILTKVTPTEWLHIYQDTDGKGDSIATKTNKTTKELFGSNRNLRWLN